MTKQARWKAAGFIYGSASHYIDHLAPICSALEIPLIVTEEELYNLIKQFYPDVHPQLLGRIETPKYLTSHLDSAFVCTPRILFDELCFFAQKLEGKKVHTLWVPHGNSDKGHVIPYMEGLQNEEMALVYGQKMIDFMQDKGAFSQLKAHVVVGDYRRAYYLRNKAFYDSALARKIDRQIPIGKKVALYAPTWRDAESSSSFLDVTPDLIQTIPKHWHLIIKLHPNLLFDDEKNIHALIEAYQTHPQVTFLAAFPPVMPVLARTDVFIGDLSSMGYDCLGFNKPMFFINHSERSALSDPGLALYKCGVEIRKEHYSNIYSIIEASCKNDSRFHEIRAKTYNYTFGPRKSAETLKKDIEKCYEKFPDPDLNFY